MALEIEKKFLIKDIPDHLEDFPKHEILQGYYIDSNKKSNRLRQTTTIKSGKKYNKYYLTQKKGHGLVRQEEEKTISQQVFKSQRKKVSHSLEKTRYFIPYENHTIELNQFHGSLEGLRMIEIEFSSIQDSEKFKKLDRFGSEITNYKEASNAYLATHGMDKLISKTHHQTTLIKQQLRNFYNNEAKKYTQTRKKIWSDADIILQNIQNLGKSELKILEIGCGSGRFLEHLSTISNIKIEYTGIDLSSQLIKQAQEIQVPKNIKTNFICADMIQYLSVQNQEEYDIIVGIASVQHLPSIQERFLCMKYIYRVLKYGGLCIMTNRSFSQRFLKTYLSSIVKAFIKYGISRGKSKRNDLLLPRKGEQKTFHRFYHIFTKPELDELSIRSGFITKKLVYLNKSGQETPDRKHANNTFYIGEKSVFE